MDAYLEEWAKNYDMNAIQAGIDSLFPQTAMNVSQMLELIIQGQAVEACRLFWVQLSGSFLGEMGSLKQVFLYLLLLGIASALFSNFSDLFAGQQIAQAGFYFLYLFLMVILTKVFLFAAGIAASTMENIVLFIKMFIPTYFMAVGAAQGTATALYYYQLMLVIAYLVESFLNAVLIPFIYSYIMLALLNGLWTEEKLSLLLDFMKKGILLALKISMGAVTGFSLVQAVIVPVLDKLKMSALRKAVSAIPGIGTVAEGVAEMVLGSAVLLKNSMGVLFVIVLLGACMLPLIKILAITGVVKLGAAMTGIVSDKRISSCTDRIGEGCFLLFRCVFTSVILFIIVIAVVAYTVSS